ncbi:hypothetical protein B0J13DRAFT_110515 [Dactylonectria estremocensis]|uniref:Secreted protein n=1 Tax=Dactylonectria estremocensis TaxID=1079267 RepID=A0A9P9FB15_9HYPO|nr:hypothetical protein B0J13DRAFT_110515 [Dactylonectria estremocensis]
MTLLHAAILHSFVTIFFLLPAMLEAHCAGTDWSLTRPPTSIHAWASHRTSRLPGETGGHKGLDVDNRESRPWGLMGAGRSIFRVFFISFLVARMRSGSNSGSRRWLE